MLKQTLSAFQAHILAADESINQAIVADGRLEVSARLAIYAHGYRARLAEALAKDFPMLKRWLGKETFQQLAYAYIENRPSTHYSIRHFGKQFSAFLQKSTDCHPAVAELARLEWALAVCYTDADVPALRFAQCGESAAEWYDNRFRLHPSLKRHVFSYAVDEYWQQLNKGDKLPDQLEKDSDKRICLVWRWQQEPCFVAISPLADRLLALFKKPRDFADICLDFSEIYPGDEQQMALFLGQQMRQWIEQGWFCADDAQA